MKGRVKRCAIIKVPCILYTNYIVCLSSFTTICTIGGGGNEYTLLECSPSRPSTRFPQRHADLFSPFGTTSPTPRWEQKQTEHPSSLLIHLHPPSGRASHHRNTHPPHALVSCAVAFFSPPLDRSVTAFRLYYFMLFYLDGGLLSIVAVQQRRLRVNTVWTYDDLRRRLPQHDGPPPPAAAQRL